MDDNLLEGFANWMRQQFNIDLKDMSEVGDIVLANVKMTPDNGNKPIEYKNATKFKVWSNEDGTVFKIQDTSYPDENQPNKADFPSVSQSPYAGKIFTLSRDQYEKLNMFPKSPDQNIGMGGMF